MDTLRQEEQVVALAGLFQAAHLVRQVAREGATDPASFETSISSVLRIDAQSTESVFGGRERLRTGLQTLCRQLGRNRAESDVEITRYVASLMYLERRLMRDRRLIERLRSGIESALEQSRHFSATHENVVASLAALYVETVATAGPRILVHGAPHYLNQAANANMIRALLLCGIRSAVLWRQRGGNRFRLLFGRRGLLACASTMLAELPA